MAGPLDVARGPAASLGSRTSNQEGGERVLALTDSAVEAVKDVVAASDETAATGGLRLFAEQTEMQTNLQLSIVTLPAEDDEVIEEAGARVFLDPGAASLLDDKVLDAEVAEGQVAFTIADQIE
jgi:iron-sulfur cluster assembly protein